MYKEYLDFIIEIAAEVGKIQLSYFRGNDLSIETKSSAHDIVTRVDKESEAYIVQEITKRYPDHKILGEEGGFRGNDSSDYIWVVDPLDGTTNYSQGIPIFAISIALRYKDETIAGVVFAPYLDELFVATKGGGAFLKYRGGDFKQLKVSNKEDLNISVLGTGFPYDKGVNADNNTDVVSRIVPHVRDLRRMGSAAYDLCCVASGLLDGYWELGLKLWDVCAGNLIVEEAGGIVVEYKQNRGIAEAAGNTKIVDEIKKHI